MKYATEVNHKCPMTAILKARTNQFSHWNLKDNPKMIYEPIKVQCQVSGNKSQDLWRYRVHLDYLWWLKGEATGTEFLTFPSLKSILNLPISFLIQIFFIVIFVFFFSLIYPLIFTGLLNHIIVIKFKRF